MARMMMGGAPQRPLSKATVRRVSTTFRGYVPTLAVIAVSVLASAALGLMPPFFLKTIINVGLLEKRLDVVTRYTLLSLGATIVATILSLGYGYLSISVGQRIMRDLRSQLFEHLQQMSMRFFTTTRTGEIQSRLANDVSGIQSVVSDTIANLLSNITIVLSTLVAMFLMDWRLSLLSVGVLPLFALIAQRVGTTARNIRTASQSRLADLNATMNETLSVSGALLMKTTGGWSRAHTRFTTENAELTELQIRMAMVMRSFFYLIGLTFSITPALVYWLAGWLILGHGDARLTLGVIVAFTGLQARLFFPLTSLLNVQVEVTSAFALFDRIFEYLDLPIEIADKPDAVALDPHAVRGDIVFNDVEFRYSPEQDPPALAHISFEARPGELVALVGASGAGKTTLTYLIPRLYDASAGSVTIDGHDVRDVRLASLAAAIGVVTQETYLIHDSIRANLRVGRPDATDAELEDAARAAAIHDHIVSLPEAYDTVVGERGYKLSGGEKQRIAIARAILKDPRILILDEATSALDTASERLIQNALDPLMKGRTTVAIAHRLSTILAADRILVLENGQIVEQGTHAELVAHGGVYARLYDAQFEEAVAVAPAQ